MMITILNLLWSQSCLGVLQLLHGRRCGHTQLLHKDHHRAPSQTEAPFGGGKSCHSCSFLWWGCSRWWALLRQRLAAVSRRHDRRGVGPKRQRGRSGEWGRTDAGFSRRLWAGGVWRLWERDGWDGGGHGPSWFTLLGDHLYPSTETAEKVKKGKTLSPCGSMWANTSCFYFLPLWLWLKWGHTDCAWSPVKSIHIKM